MIKKISSLPVGMKLGMMVALLVGTFIVSGGLTYYNTKHSEELFERLGFIHLPAIRNASMIDMMHDNIYGSAYRGVAMIKSPLENRQTIRKDLDESIKTIQDNFSQLSKLGVSPELQDAITKSETEVNEYIAAANQIMDAVLSGDENAARAQLPNVQEKFEALEGKLAGVSDLVEKLSNSDRDRAIDLGRSSLSQQIIAVGFSVLICLLVGFFVSRNLVTSIARIVERLQAESHRLGTVTRDVDHSAQKLSSSATEQAAAIEQTVSSMEEMTAMLGQTSLNSENSLKIADDGTSEAKNGNVIANRMITAMADIQEANGKLSRVESLIKEIDSKTKVINDIVFETRLLSFNASIEAARAGAHGKGFAVVAEEVGKLAAMSGKAADEIRGLLESSTKEVGEVVILTQEKVQAGQDVARECQSAFENMEATLNKIGTSVRSIVSATKEQESGVQQTTNAMAQMDQATQMNAASSDQLASSASKLSHVVEEVDRNVAEMVQLIGKSMDSVQSHAASHTRSMEPSLSSHEPEHVAPTVKPRTLVVSSTKKPQPTLKPKSQPEEAKNPSPSSNEFQDFTQAPSRDDRRWSA